MTAVYVAAPYEDAAFVRDVVHESLRHRGYVVTSTWAESATGPENFARFSPEQLRRACATNDCDVMVANVVLVLARHGAGGEMFAEARYALTLGRPLVWCGHLRLSAWREGVVRCSDLDAAYYALACIDDAMRRGVRHAEDLANSVPEGR